MKQQNTYVIPISFLLCVLSLFMAGCSNSLLDRSLVFSTGTTFGVEVAVSPAETQSPAKIIIGYKRFESVLNPVFYDHRAAPRGGNDKTTTATNISPPATVPASQPNVQTVQTATAPADQLIDNPPANAIAKVNDYYRTNAYSVIAKFKGDANAGAGSNANGKLSVAQWFATGVAAETLAKQPGIAGAVSGSADIAEAAADDTSNRLSALEPAVRRTVLLSLSTIYSKAESSPHPENKRFLAILNASLLPAKTTPPSSKRYEFGADKVLTRTAWDAPIENYSDLITLLEQLKFSQDKITEALKDSSVEKGDITVDELISAYTEQSQLYQSIEKNIVNDPAVKQALKYLSGHEE